MRHDLRTEVEIDAPPETVWEILTDLDQYADWNPFIVSSTGTASEGQRLRNQMQPPNGRSITFKPLVTEIKPRQTLEWLGRLGLPGIFDGRHRFELSAGANGGTHLVHSEQLRGLLVPFLRSSLETQTLPGFEAMNQALKARAEAATDRAATDEAGS